MVRPRSMKYCECCKTNLILNRENTRYCKNCGRFLLKFRTLLEQRHYRARNTLNQQIIDLRKRLLKHG